MKKIALMILVFISAYGIFFWYKRAGQPHNAPYLNGIVAGTTADFPPFSYRDKNNDIVGFDIDVAKEVAQRLDKEIEFKDMPFDSLLPQLKTGTIHIISAGISETPERQKSVLFTKPYLTGNPLLVVALKGSNINSLEDLKNKHVIVNTGYLGDLYMSKVDKVNLKRVTSVADAFLFLKNKQGDAFIGAALSVKPFLENHDKNNFKTFIIEETDENSSIAVSPIYQDLYKDIQKALEAMETDGTLSALKNKWNVA